VPEYTAIAHGFPEHPKVMGLHDRAFRLHVTALDYCSRNLTDGHVSARAVKVIAAILDTQSKRWTAELVNARLWKLDESGDGFWINDYLVYNPSAAAMRDLRDKRRTAGVRGAEKRWRGNNDDTGDSKSHDKGHGKPHMPGEEKGGSSGSRSIGRKLRARTTDDGLPINIDHELLVSRLMQRIGDDADTGTKHVVNSYAAQLPPASVAKVVESLELQGGKVRDRAEYAVAALRSELAERNA
jgi:hypothetical protein